MMTEVLQEVLKGKTQKFKWLSKEDAEKMTEDDGSHYKIHGEDITDKK